MENKTAAQAIDDIRIELGLTQKHLADKIGANSPQVVQNMLYRNKDMRTSSLIRFANALGYDLVLKNRVTDKEILLVKDDGE